jgi:hypothetical protein
VKGPRHRAEIRSVPGAALCSICVCGTELTGPSTKEVVGRLMGGTRSQRQQNQPTRCLLCHRKRTLVGTAEMSAKCQKRTFPAWCVSINPRQEMINSSLAFGLSHSGCQLALRTSVSSTSVTVITPGAGCSITSTPTVSTTGVTGCFTFRAAFFTGAGLGLALATVRFGDFARADLLPLPRLADFPLGSFPRFCTFDAFLRLAMIAPFGAAQRYNGPTRSQLSNASYQQIAADPLLTDRAPKRDRSQKSLPCSGKETQRPEHG